MLETEKINEQEESPVARTTASAKAAFLLCLSNSKEPQTGTNGKREKRKLRFALSRCTIIPERFLACVPAADKKPMQLHMTVDGQVHYGNECFDTIAVEAVTNVKEAEGRAKSLTLSKATPSDEILQAAAYVQSNGNYCYHCRQEELEEENIETNCGSARQKIQCRCCGRSWYNVYTLTGVSEK